MLSLHDACAQALFGYVTGAKERAFILNWQHLHCSCLFIMTMVNASAQISKRFVLNSRCEQRVVFSVANECIVKCPVKKVPFRDWITVLITCEDSFAHASEVVHNIAECNCAIFAMKLFSTVMFIVFLFFAFSSRDFYTAVNCTAPLSHEQLLCGVH